MKNVDTLLIVFLISWLFYNDAYGQNTNKKLVLDEFTYYPIPYATIKVLNKPYGVFTNGEGEFYLKNNGSDSLLISCIGYHSKIVNEIFDTIFLAPKDYSLDEVTIRSTKRKEFKIGYDNLEKVIMHTVGFSAEAVLKIEIPSRYQFYQIKAIKLKCRNPNNEPLTKLHIYDLDNNGFPGKELLHTNIIVNNHLNSHKIVDLSDQKLFLSEKELFVGIEWMISENRFFPLNPKKKNSNQMNLFYIGFSNAFAQSKTYVRSIQFSEYLWILDHPMLRNLKNSLYPGNLMISLIIE